MTGSEGTACSQVRAEGARCAALCGRASKAAATDLEELDTVLAVPRDHVRQVLAPCGEAVIVLRVGRQEAGCKSADMLALQLTLQP